MKNIGTKHALNYICNIIYEKIDKSQPIAVTFLDLAKAFDTVNHKLLLDKLYNYGFRGIAYMLMSSYLANRKQRVLVGESVSDFCTVNTGVPQRTILGVLLFLLYVNDLLSSMPSDTILSFADDTAVVSTGTWTQVEAKMNEYLESVQNWLALNRLSLNIDKTVVMTSGSYNNSVPINIGILINGKLLKRVERC